MGSLLRDLRYSSRSLLRDKPYSATVLITLAACLAANTAIFGVVYSILLRPLPFPQAEDVLLMGNRYPKATAEDARFSSGGDYFDRLRDMTVFEQQAMFQFRDATVDVGGSPRRIRAMVITPSLLPLLRTAPAIGRGFTPEEAELGNERKVILSHGLWRDLYGSDRMAVGRQLRVNGRACTIVGVLPAGFDFMDPEVRLWMPLTMRPDQKTGRHSNNWFHIGRLKPGATLDQAQAQVDSINSANFDRFPQWKQVLIDAGFYTSVEPLQELLVGSVRGSLHLLWGGALAVLLLGALNVANLGLARISLRRSELATRLALGAGHGSLTRQVVVESVTLALISGLAAAAAAAVILRVMALSTIPGLPRLHEIRLDWTVFSIGFLLALAAGLLLGLITAASVLRANLRDALQQDGRGAAGGRGGMRIRRTLVVAQIAIAFLLVTGAGLLVESLRQLLRVDPGYQTEGVVTASINLPSSPYAGPPELRDFMRRSLTEFLRIPGVQAAGATTGIPLLEGYHDVAIVAEGYQMRPGESFVAPKRLAVSPGYFEAMRIRLVRGRFFDDRDDGSFPVVIVDQHLARRFWGDADPLGRRMFQPSGADMLRPNANTRWITVVGVVGSIRLQSLAEAVSPMGVYYFPYGQTPVRNVTLAVRTSAPQSTLQALPAAISAINPELPLFDLKTMSQRVDLSLAGRRTSLRLAAMFGLLALFISAVGIYGVLICLVNQRRREIGIRLALGSSPSGIVTQVVKEGGSLTAAGLLCGILAAVLLRKTLLSAIYGVHPLNPFLLALVMCLLTAVALLACLLPARRAARVDPIEVLKQS
ncbi:MAG: ABC transporter permease [Acidimicrobiia bacterium]|nr:ABC transporter permease [Acidimicrobiia bacterium]